VTGLRVASSRGSIDRLSRVLIGVSRAIQTLRMAFLRTVVNLAIVAAASSTIVQPGAVGAPSAPAMRSTTSNGAAMLRLKGGEAEITDQTKISVFSKKDRLAITLSDFMRERCIDNKNDKDSRDLECIMNGVQAACRLIADMVGKSGIQDMTGLAGTGENVQGEEQKKLDILSNDVFKDKLAKTGCMAFLGSEEEDEAIHITGRHGGDYVAVFDPLDGSSNIDAAISVGTIFGIYKSNGAKNFPLLKGDQQVASGYCMYSTCSILMITLGDGVHGFTLDTSMGEFVMTHPNVKMPKRGKIYSTNQGNCPQWSPGIKEYFDTVSAGKGESGEKYSLRYIGSMVGDMHRTLLYGGVFLYPADEKNKNGKLRLLYEASPMAMLAEQAGGKAHTGKENVLKLQPTMLHARCPIYIGSSDDVDEVLKYVNK